MADVSRRANVRLTREPLRGAVGATKVLVGVQP